MVYLLLYSKTGFIFLQVANKSNLWREYVFLSQFYTVWIKVVELSARHPRSPFRKPTDCARAIGRCNLTFSYPPEEGIYIIYIFTHLISYAVSRVVVSVSYWLKLIAWCDSVHWRRYTICHSACPRLKIQMDSPPPLKCFVHKRAYSLYIELKLKDESYLFSFF